MAHEIEKVTLVEVDEDTGQTTEVVRYRCNGKVYNAVRHVLADQKREEPFPPNKGDDVETDVEPDDKTVDDKSVDKGKTSFTAKGGKR